MKKLGGGVPRDAEFYRIENRRLLEQKDSYMQQNEELSHELAKVSEDQVKLEQEMESSRKLIRDLRAEVSLIEKQNVCSRFVMWFTAWLAFRIPLHYNSLYCILSQH